MINYSFYHKDTGLFSDKKFSTCAPLDFPAHREAPSNHLVIEGHHDHLSKRFHIETGKVIDYQPPQPTVNHVWNDAIKRWEIDPAYKAKLSAHFDALRKISELEKLTARFLREQHLGTNPKATERLTAIESEIVELRKAVMQELLSKE